MLPNVLSKITWIMNLKEIKTLFNFIIKYDLLVSQVDLHLQNLFTTDKNAYIKLLYIKSLNKKK